MNEILTVPRGYPLPAVARRMRMDQFCSLQESFNPDQHRHEQEKRAQIARKVRVLLRNREPVVVLSPRWSQPLAFLEELALDLINGRPALDCRTVRFRRLKGRGLPEVWNHLVEVFQRLIPVEHQLSGPALVADRRGFRWSLQQLLQRAHEHAPRPITLLACEAEHLPLSVLEDVVQVWEEYALRYLDNRRCVLLLAGSIQAHWLRIGSAPRIELGDYSEREAAAAMVSRADRGSVSQLSSVARFTGGIPSIVDRFSAHYAEHGELPRSKDGLIQILGTLGDEMRGVVDIVAADDVLASRIDALISGEVLPEQRALDEPLRLAGLLRIMSTPLHRAVCLRAPALAALLG